MPLYVAEGKSITTRRGVVGCDDDRPEISAKDLGAIAGDEESHDKAHDNAERLLEKGYLVEADESPWHKAEAARVAQIAKLEGPGDALRVKQPESAESEASEAPEEPSG